MSAGIMDHHDIPNVDLGQRPVDGKLVVVLTQRTRHIVEGIAGLVLFAHHGDVMVRACLLYTSRCV